MSAFSAAQQQRATALYRSLLRTTRALFAGDAHAIQAAYDETRRKFLEARTERDAQKIDEGLEMGEQIVYLLKHNVVQGVDDDQSHRYKLRFTKDTELGSNDSIKVRPAPSLAEIKKSRGPRTPCAGLHTAARPQARAYSTRARDEKLPRPVPQFPQRVLLADGSSIQLTTTSPRHLMRLTRDYTNHPLWNPTMGHRTDADTEDDTGRLGRFRRRFAEEAAQAQQSISFDEGDLDWMSGGREAREGTPMVTKKAKGKGRK